MFRLHVTSNIVHLTVLKSYLDEAGIRYETKNEILNTLSGEVPAHDVLPEVWVSDDDAGRATIVLEQLKADGWRVDIDPDELERQALEFDHPD